MQPGSILRSPLASYKVIRITDKTVIVSKIRTGRASESASDAERSEGGILCRKVHRSSGCVHIHISRHECAYL